ncbi:hypothetical protein, partial [Xanthomonas campestris]
IVLIKFLKSFDVLQDGWRSLSLLVASKSGDRRLYGHQTILLQRGLGTGVCTHLSKAFPTGNPK